MKEKLESFRIWLGVVLSVGAFAFIFIFNGYRCISGAFADYIYSMDDCDFFVDQDSIKLALTDITQDGDSLEVCIEIPNLPNDVTSIDCQACIESYSYYDTYTIDNHSGSDAGIAATFTFKSSDIPTEPKSIGLDFLIHADDSILIRTHVDNIEYSSYRKEE